MIQLTRCIEDSTPVTAVGTGMPGNPRPSNLDSLLIDTKAQRCVALLRLIRAVRAATGYEHAQVLAAQSLVSMPLAICLAGFFSCNGVQTLQFFFLGDWSKQGDVAFEFPQGLEPTGLDHSKSPCRSINPPCKNFDG